MNLTLYKYSFGCMGCPCTISLYCDDLQTAEKVSKAVIAELNRLDKYYTDYSDYSFTAEMNRSAGTKTGIIVDDETAILLDYADECYRLSEGLFDITAGVLKEVWNFKVKNPRLPEESRIKDLLKRTGWDKAIWKKPHLVLPIKGMKLDFGGVVKEYAADFAANICRSYGVQYGLVDLGGDLAVIGPHPDGRAWGVGVQHPRKIKEDIAVIPLQHGGLASSGDYERFFEIEDKRYSHILNPKTGWPIEGLSAVSVVADLCVIAGSASTIAMLKGKEEGVQWLESTGLRYFCADLDGQPLSKLQ